MTHQDDRPAAAKRPSKQAELTDADKALLEAEPDWERMGQAAKRLLSGKPEHQITRPPVAAPTKPNVQK